MTMQPEIAPFEIDRMREIQEEIKELMHEFDQYIPRNTGAYSRWTAYPKGNILTHIDNGSEYAGGAMYSMEDIINECYEYLPPDYRD